MIRAQTHLHFLLLGYKLSQRHVVVQQVVHGALVGVFLDRVLVHLKRVLHLHLVALLQLLDLPAGTTQRMEKVSATVPTYW